MDDLKIRQKAEDMIAYAYIVLHQFPKTERHVLNQEVRQTMWRLLHLIVLCNKRYYKKTTMQDLDAELDLLRSQVRIAQTLKYLSFKSYETWSRKIDEIGRMVGGWIKSSSLQSRGGG
jgi:hypothetical protein